MIPDLFSSATTHHQAGRLDEAEPLYRQVLSHQPDHANALNQLGYLLFQKEQHQEALDLIQKAIAINPTSAEYRNNAGLALMGLGRMEEAVTEYNTALEFRQNFPEIHNNLGNALAKLGRLADARQAINRALQLRPNLPAAWDNLGQISKLEQKYDQAIEAHRQAISFKPDFAEAHFNVGLLYLLKGDLRAGFRESEWRWKFLKTLLPRPLFEQTLWDGSNLDGRRIFVQSEGGFGDAIQYVRLLPLVQKRGGKVLLGCPRDLFSLLQGLEGADEIFPSGVPVPKFDVQCPAASLACFLDITLENLPTKVPYLHPDPTRIRYWRQKIPAGDKRLKVGLVWAGRPDFANDYNRSMALAQLAPLSQIPNVWFFSLQKGVASEQLRMRPPGWEITDWTDELKEYADTAAMITQLDLVISVDTSVAHLAGALAKPVWVLLPLIPDWRWMLDRSDSPWYPTMRLFRQQADQDWTKPIEQVVQALREFSR
jgi:Flp pilus assembly protein TadD